MAHQKPLFLGRGRGRGNQAKGRSAVTVKQNQDFHGGFGRQKRQFQNDSITEAPATDVFGRTSKEGTEDSSRMSIPSRERLDKVKKIQESAQKFVFEDVDDESSEEEMDNEAILASTMKNYRGVGLTQEDDSVVDKTSQYLVKSFQSGSNACLICIEQIKRTDAIWNCSQCACMFHIQCIQKWARDGAIKLKNLSDESFPEQDVNWFCPKCRCEYKADECPSRYFCFCGKVEDPRFDPWLVPHSCGQTCSKSLKPDCGHNCLLLCHPGPCPPCPKTVKTKCHCQSEGPVTRRCSNRNWSCGRTCERPLSCSHHNCQQPCHDGECPPCPKQSVQPCVCGKNEAIRPCAVPDWNCTVVCGRYLSCGHHVCERVCHSGDCGTCPRSGLRTCPCGKTKEALPCTEDIPTCGDTCSKELSCGRHSCTLRCHAGPCEICRQMIVKRCRCGKKDKEVQCSQELTCEIKCAALRNCQRHQCRKKCCDGNCPVCEQTCGRTLKCKNHKCPSQCHRGLCYPCPSMVEVTCFCGATSKRVPCGSERYTKPPRCSEPCQIPPDCHHSERKPHRCHFGVCPTCRQVCAQPLSGCEHKCPEPCHDHKQDPGQLKPKVQKTQAWGLVQGPSTGVPKEFCPMPCPPCQVPLEVPCFGRHEKSTLPCSNAVEYSCRRPCGQNLPCGNHTCQLECHIVSEVSVVDGAGAECKQCEEPCVKPRPSGCDHVCFRPCHPGDCPKCKQVVRKRCHCQLMVLSLVCNDFTSASEEDLLKLFCCQNHCHKNLTCGHKCPSLCHPGECPSADKCTRRATLICPCKRKKKDFPCLEVQNGLKHLQCDEICKAALEEKMRQEEEAEKARREEELRQQKEDLEWFERKKQGKKRKVKKVVEEVKVDSLWSKYKKHLAISSSLVILVMFFYYLLDIS